MERVIFKRQIKASGKEKRWQVFFITHKSVSELVTSLATNYRKLGNYPRPNADNKFKHVK